MPKTKDGGFILDDSKITAEYAEKQYRRMLKKTKRKGSKGKTRRK